MTLEGTIRGRETSALRHVVEKECENMDDLLVWPESWLASESLPVSAMVCVAVLLARVELSRSLQYSWLVYRSQP